MRAVYVEEDVITDWENQDNELLRPYKENLNLINAAYLLSILISLILVRTRNCQPSSTHAKPSPTTNLHDTGGAQRRDPKEMCDGG